jgi:hypothetical protein
MLTDFKYLTIVEDGTNITVTVVFYEGEMTTEDEIYTENLVLEFKPVTRYRRSKMIGEDTFVYPVGYNYDNDIINELKEPRLGVVRTPIPQQM